MKCYNCQKLGHPAYRCPEKPSSSHGGEKRVNSIQEEGSSTRTPAMNLAPEDGESLMMTRVLMQEPHKCEVSQRRALFRIMCKIFRKVCKMVIDSSSTDNIISEEAVSKFNLPRMRHNEPYKVTWLNKGQHVLVNEQACVDFNIGEYKDRILCDILPMDACHLLLGRPWQFDRRAHHDGEKNTYSFQKNGIVYKIQSLSEEIENNKPKTPKVLLVN